MVTMASLIDQNHFHMVKILIAEVMEPRIPAVAPLTEPGLTKEYETGRSSTTLMVSIIKGFKEVFFSFSF